MLMLGDGFNVAGCHQTVSGCSLPPSIPEDVLDRVTAHFTLQMQDDFKRLLKVPDLSAICARPYADKRRERTDSTQTQPTSGTRGVDGGAGMAFIDYIGEKFRI